MSLQDELHALKLPERLAEINRRIDAHPHDWGFDAELYALQVERQLAERESMERHPAGL